MFSWPLNCHFPLGPAAFLGSRWQAEGPGFSAVLVCRQGMVAGGGWDRRPQFSIVSPLQLPVGRRTAQPRVSSWLIRASGDCRSITANISSSSCSEEGWMAAPGRSKKEQLGRLGRPGYQGGVRSHFSKPEISLWLERNQGTVQHPGRNERQEKKNLTSPLMRDTAFMSSDERNTSRKYDKICPGKAYFWATGTFSYGQCEASAVHFFLFALVVRKAIF